MKKSFASHKTHKPAGISEKVIRLLEIYTMIAQRQFPSTATLVDRFGVTERTIYRYLEQINMIDAIEFDRESNGYKFTHGDRIKKMMLGDKEMITLFTASEAVSRLGTAFRENFQGLLDKMFAVTGKSAETAKVPIIVKTPDASISERIQNHLMTISLCMKEKRSVSMLYRALGAKEATERIVDPYGLVFYDGVWILIGYCHLRKELRSFAMDRIIDLKERFLYFELRGGFDLEEYISSSWGVVHEEPVTITVRFTANVAEFILRKEKWHPSEQRKVLFDGDVELTFTVAGVNEIKHWIYSWLPNVEIIEPAWLRQQARKELARSAKEHAKNYFLQN
jgi:predicted DNA-binding transcriptional regulator YafY